MPIRPPRINPLRRAMSALLAATSLLAIAPMQAQAADFPSRPISLVVGYPPGGSNDILARLVAPRLADILGTSVVVENRAGANGTIGATFVARSAPDGYTLLASSASPIAITPQTMRTAPFDPVKDFAAINTVGLVPEAIAIGPNLKVNTLAELIALARDKEVTLSSSGTGGLPHLTIELLKKAAGGNILHVPYRGGGPAIVDTLAGHVDGIVMDLTPLQSQIQSGALKALAVTSAERVDFLPDVPTAQENLPGFNVVNWFGLFAPARTPPEVVKRISDALVQVVNEPEIREQLTRNAVIASTYDTPAGFQEFFNKDVARWGAVIKDANVPLSD